MLTLKELDVLSLPLEEGVTESVRLTEREDVIVTDRLIAKEGEAEGESETLSEQEEEAVTDSEEVPEAESDGEQVPESDPELEREGAEDGVGLEEMLTE